MHIILCIHIYILLGTGVFYQPGMLIGGKIDHDCSTQRSIGYYLEGLICLAPFVKNPLKITLRGVTNDQIDPSVRIAIIKTKSKIDTQFSRM